MPLQTTVFFEQVLRQPYEHLLQTQIAKDLLSGNFRLHGTQLNAGDTVLFDGAHLDSGEVARLLMTFDGTRIHQQNQHDVWEDDGPPGIYFTATNAEVIHEGHKNRVGIYQETAADRSLFLDAIDEGDIALDRALHEPMRYQCRPAGKPAFYDAKYPGTYNARRDNLEGFWRGLFGYTHGLMLVTAVSHSAPPLTLIVIPLRIGTAVRLGVSISRETIIQNG